MTTRQPNNPLHGVTLEMMLREMYERFGWEGLARDIPVNCFLVDPTMNSALKYLRKAPRARKKVEEVYARFVAAQSRSSSRAASGSAPPADQSAGAPTGITRPSRNRTR